MIQVFRPSMGEEEIEAVSEVIRSGWIGLGPKVAEFESKFASYAGAKYAVALNSCTAALHLALTAFGIGENDEVILPTLTFVSTAHAVEYTRATPVFCDIEPDTLCISVEDAKTKITNKTKAIIPVHYGGHPCEMQEIQKFSKKYNLVVVEDAAHACGTEYKIGKKSGALSGTERVLGEEKAPLKWVKIGSCIHSDAACFSFHAVKNLATGDGGMITTQNPEVTEQLKRIRWMGIDKTTWKRTGRGESTTHPYEWYYEVPELGFKYHMNDIAAAIGLVQLKKLDSLNARRREIVARYNEAFKDIPWIETPVEKPGVRSAHHNYVIKTPYRDELNLYLKNKGVATSVHYLPLHLQPYYRAKYKITLPVAEKIWKELLTLPLFPDLTNDEVSYVIDSLRKFR